MISIKILVCNHIRMVPCKSPAKEVSFEWSHHRISSTNSKVGTTLHVSITDSESDRVIISTKGLRWSSACNGNVTIIQ